MAFWSLDEIRGREAEVRAAFDELMAQRRVVPRPRSRQWRFFRSCLVALVDSTEPELGAARTTAAQYKFEVEDRLRRYYRSPGRPLSIVFSLMDRSRALLAEIVDEAYPSTLGYVLLVSDARPEQTLLTGNVELRQYLARVVDDAARAEFDVYRRLPVIDLAPIDRYFRVDSPAYLRIRTVVEGHAKRERCISFPLHNPSTMRVLKLRVQRVEATAAVVTTLEYWYLRWWSLRKQAYSYVYQETNHQRYHLVQLGDQWLVEGNIYPPPRNTTPQRSAR